MKLDDIRSTLRKSLIVGHVFPWGEHDLNVFAVGYGFIRVTQILGCLSIFGLCEFQAQSLVTAKIKFLRFGVLRWPFCEGIPGFPPRVKNQGLELGRLSGVLQEMTEKRGFDFPLIEFGNLLTKDNIPDHLRGPIPRPVAVAPRSHDENVERFRIVLLHLAIDVQRSI